MIREWYTFDPPPSKILVRATAEYHRGGEVTDRGRSSLDLPKSGRRGKISSSEQQTQKSNFYGSEKLDFHNQCIIALYAKQKGTAVMRDISSPVVSM
ncbi:hypothetical protein TNCV_4138941 [Trichonephila clavipes]|nr:hypothetical protein TNCV_4138941 [Trichonephila clavipes]